jgi:hypothetical protein
MSIFKKTLEFLIKNAKFSKADEIFDQKRQIFENSNKISGWKC